MLQHLIIQFLLYYISQVVTYGRLKTRKNFKLLALKLREVVTYKRFQI